jgi:glucosamine--fructose-6-phosphate aminotransferase (isomerizing)
VVNAVGSSIARETNFGLYLHAGPEIGVASTKAFTSQMVALALFTLHMGRRRHLSVVQGREMVQALKHLPDQVAEVLELEPQIVALAEEYKHETNFLYLGRGYQFPVALEGALKLKEVSYVHAEGYAAGEMKHGPISLLDAECPLVAVATRSSVYEKLVSNVMEGRARDARVVAVATEGDPQIERFADDVLWVPDTHEAHSPVLAIIPLQLFAYHVAVARGTDVDQPRNLAKSVTVE